MGVQVSLITATNVIILFHKLRNHHFWPATKYVRVSHKFFPRPAIYHLEPAMWTYLFLVYSIDFNLFIALSKYVSLVTKSLSTPFSKDGQQKHLPHVVLHYFKRGSSAKGTAVENCIVYGSGPTTIKTIYQVMLIWKMKTTAAAHNDGYGPHQEYTRWKSATWCARHSGCP